MKSSMKKRMIAFMLCMVLIISNSVSILADTPEAETTSVEQAAETTTEKAKEATTEKKEETTTKEKKEETTEAEEKATTEEKKEEKTEKKEEATSEEKKEETTETTEEKKDSVEETTEAKAEEATTEEKKETAEEEKEETTAAQTLTYENDDVTVKVSAKAENSIPEGAALKVVPVLKDNAETTQQYQNVEQKIQEKAAETKTEIAGFLAYDIFLIDKEGNEVEPNGDVQVSMEYKESVIPEQAAEATDTDVTVMHLEENEEGQVKEVVDMSKSDQLKNIETTAEQKVQKAEFVTNSFSVYTITWTRNSIRKIVKFHYVDSNGQDIPGGDLNKDVSSSSENNTIDLTSSEYQKTFEGYTYTGTYLNKYNSDKTVTKLSINRRGSLKYYDEEDESHDWNAASYDVYFVYTKNTTPPSGGSGGSSGSSGSSLGAPAHRKYIKKHDDDNYTLTLDVTGEQGAATPIDILLIVDKSGSMEDNDRYQNVNNAINALTTELKKATGVEISLAVVTFSSAGLDKTGNDTQYNSDDDKVDAWTVKNWTSLNGFNYSLSKSDCTGGTNWQAGVRQGESLLASRPAENRKYVLFLTDGDPTFRYKGDSSTITQGEGDDDSNNNNYNAAVNEWGKSSNLKSTVARYVIDANPRGANKCDEFAGAISATELSGSSNETMLASFKKIADDIIKPAYKNVSIQDTLSDYVGFAQNLNLKVYKVNKTANEETLLLANQYTYSVNEKTIKIELLKGAELEDGVTYRASFDIVTTLEAYYEYGTNGYGETKGDPNTDAPKNNTSSGKEGLHSNAEAKVNYQINDNPSESALYDHPVVQVKEEKTNWIVKKKWVGTNLDSVDVQLKAEVTIGDETRAINNSNYKSLPDNMKVKLSESNDWEYTWNNLPQYYYYEDTNKQIQKVAISYSVDEPTVPEGYRKDVVVDNETNTTTITNSNKNWKLVKISSSSTDDSMIMLQGAEFTLMSEDKKVYIGVSGEDGSVTWKDGNENVAVIPDGTYTLTETKAPTGYQLGDNVTIIIKDGVPTVENEKVGGLKAKWNDKETVLTVYYADDVLYELPSAGGSGIYCYLIGGMLLMMAASLILYRNKNLRRC